MEYIEKTLTGIITHGTNSITFTDDFITNESIIDVYFSDDDITPTEQTQDGNRLIISIESQPQDVSIAVHITNDDTINYSDELESLSDTVDEHTTTISDLAIDVDALENEFDILENKVDGLNANNISYDKHSTLYSAMGDIDDLDTTSKNLVGAINEVKESGGGSTSYFNNVCSTIDNIKALVPNIGNSTVLYAEPTLSNTLVGISSIGKLCAFRLTDTIIDLFGVITIDYLFSIRITNNAVTNVKRITLS